MNGHTRWLIALALLAGLGWTENATESESHVQETPVTTPSHEQTAEPKGQSPLPYRVSRETTFLTEPLQDNGMVDYAAAINRRASQGVIPKTNAAVPLFESLGVVDEYISDEFRKQFFSELGVPLPPRNGQYFLDTETFSRQHSKVDETDFADMLKEQLNVGSGLPWTQSQFPELVKWLVVNEQPLAKILKSTTRDSYYCPIVVGRDVNPILIGARTPLLSGGRQVARALTARAMLALHEGRVADALKDVLACHKLAKLTANGSSFIEKLISVAIHGFAFRADVEILKSHKMSQNQLAVFAESLREFTVSPQFAESIARYNRLDTLSWAVWLAVNDWDDEVTPFESFDGLKLLYEHIDWNIVMQTINGRFDELDQVTATLNHNERRIALDRILKEVERFETDVYSTITNPDSLLKGSVNRVRLSELVGNLTVSVTFNSFRPRDLEAQWTTELQLVQTAVALERYRMDYKQFPDDLSTLKPSILGEIPIDSFSHRHLIYRPAVDGYLLYSVGFNGTDDGGRTKESTPRGDDLVVRMTVDK